MHACVYTHTHTHVCAYLHAYIHMLHTYMRTHIHTYTHTHIRMRTYTHTHIPTRCLARVHTCIYGERMDRQAWGPGAANFKKADKLTRIHTFMIYNYTRVCAYVHTYTHIYTRWNRGHTSALPNRCQATDRATANTKCMWLSSKKHDFNFSLSLSLYIYIYIFVFLSFSGRGESETIHLA